MVHEKMLPQPETWVECVSSEASVVAAEGNGAEGNGVERNGA
jgi:hypothetical protein